MAVSASCVPLSYKTTHVSTVSWSDDDKIAVTTSEAIFLLTLKGVTHCIHATNAMGKPPFVMSLVACPQSQPHPPPIGRPQAATAYDPRPGKANFGPTLDHVINGGCGGEGFVASGWSPVACNHLGGCVLAVLTSSGRLLLLSPPGISLTKWVQEVNLTDTYCHLLSGCGFNLNQLWGEQRMENSDTEEKVSFEEYGQRRLMVAGTVFAWLPRILSTDTLGVGGVAVVAMGTRSGHVTLFQLQVPLTKGSTPEVAVVCVCELPLGPPGLGEAWPTSLRWNYSKPVEATLVVGCTNGQTFSMHWDDIGGQRSSGVIGRLEQPVVRVLWPCSDGVGVYHICWETQEDGGEPQWVILSKGCSLVALPGSSLQHTHVCSLTSPQNQSTPPPHLEVSGIHTMPISGLSWLPPGEFISSSLDGSVQRFTLPADSRSHDLSCESHVLPEPVSMEMLAVGHAYSVQGVGVSHKGIFAAMAINPHCDFSYHRKRFRSQLHFLTLASSRSIEARVKEEAASEWDLCEYLRQSVDKEPGLLRFVEDSLNESGTIGTSVRRLKLQLQLHMITQKDQDRGKQCVAALLHHHTVSSLMAWGTWREGSSTIMDPQSNVSLQLMCQWLLTSELTTPSETELVEWVLTQVPVMSSGTEVCPVCGEDIPLTNLLQEICCNGHSWKRCTITLCLAAQTLCSKCTLCEATTHNTQSVPTVPGSWMHYLLLSMPRCVLCDGFFERLV